ncbi:MAG: homoserine dehydrogenase [Lactococcus raffinolactis]|jgi:homoserine dehydrogenase|uniref:homoserine dehydrogenase n=1 Tax=Pseudolactococcus raffinolactis TaxID=1366 RepID=UPI002651534A|nr:homoserine dehydrogenase [Lactococcus raffinolactis]MDN5579385.1 homoserine dehydrogenase [Lactococcus raffinolactis]MDN6037016.1 homoserine dehydrogenase [Lactococcus raffinolactis]MDN6044110.1 homoserine dehydrogenase [Lactococcus raffinolactis]MDN6083380.1 homoserine dehydrogenase [Lactococcus raffinolactis]
MTINIALLGFGTVASGIPFLLQENGEKITSEAGTEIQIAKVLVRDDAEKDALLAKGHDFNFVTDISAILNDDTVDIVIELMGRIEPAKTFITQALQAKKHVVTANKDLLAVHGTDLLKVAKDNGVVLYYEAAVAGGIPILRTLANSYTADKITKILGVVNGTSNFMMTKMVDEGWTYDEALAEASRLGYAESDPTNDVDGIDAAYKMVILSQFAFGMTIKFEDVRHEGIRHITPEDVKLAQKLGFVIKLVGEIVERPSGIYAEVVPTFLPKNHQLATVNGVMNAVFVESIGINEAMFYGPGAGQKPTATSVVADVIELAKGINKGDVLPAFNTFTRETVYATKEDLVDKYYFAIETEDKAGQLLHLAELFHAENVSFEQVFQENIGDNRASIAIISHKMDLNQFDSLVEKISALDGFTLRNTIKVI